MASATVHVIEPITININNTPENSDDIVAIGETVRAQIISPVTAVIQLSNPDGHVFFDQANVPVTAGVPATINITARQQASQTANDVQIIAAINENQVGHANMTVVSVTFPSSIQNDDTPLGMPPRIPPRVDTPIVVTLQPPDLSACNCGQKVTLATNSTSADHGDFTIGGGQTQDITKTGTVVLLGTRQTAPTGSGLPTGEITGVASQDFCTLRLKSTGKLWC